MSQPVKPRRWTRGSQLFLVAFVLVIVVVEVTYGWQALSDAWPRLVYDWTGILLSGDHHAAS